VQRRRTEILRRGDFFAKDCYIKSIIDFGNTINPLERGVALFQWMRASCLSCKLLKRTMIVDVKGTYLPLCSPCFTIASMSIG